MTALFRLTELEEDTQLYQEVKRLHQFSVFGRWCFVGILWLSIGIMSLWGLKPSLELATEYFTWASIRYGLRYHYWAGIGLTFCIAMTFAVLLWQSRNILLGLPQDEQKRLVEKVLQIRRQGKTHPLWQWVCRGKTANSDSYRNP